MRFIATAALCGAALLTSAPAGAASYIVSPTSVSLDRGDDFSWTVNLAATAGTGTDGAAGTIQYKFVSANAAGTVWNFSYIVDNTSVAPSSSAELASFGFDTGATVGSVTTGAGNLFSAGLNTGNFNGLGNRDVCFYAGANCNGGSSNGIGAADAPEAGTFALTFGSGVQTLALDNFVARWQSTGANGRGSASGGGSIVVPPAVPEPATWALMILGFGVVGYAMRRRTVRYGGTQLV